MIEFLSQDLHSFFSFLSFFLYVLMIGLFGSVMFLTLFFLGKEMSTDTFVW